MGDSVPYPRMMFIYNGLGEVTGSMLIRSADELADVVASLPDDYEVTDVPPPAETPPGARAGWPGATPRGQQISVIGQDILAGGFMSETFLDLALNAVVTWAAGYRPDLGHGVRRRLKIEDVGDDYVDVSVRLTGYQDPQEYYRLTLHVTELQH